MSPERWPEVEALFESALERPPAERSGFLARACGGDGELRRSVEALLEADDDKDAFLADVVAGGVDLWNEGRLEGQRVGAFRLVERIGYGGMGVVYLAERAEREYDQRVAIKVIRPGLDGGPILERFHAERQILAGLEHPNIARFLDGGTTADGRPYLVMEYIEGQPIDRYCDERRLTLEERLALFRSVCDAAQYAHQHLVIHRDLKPSNILVTAEGTVKLLDFGIARIVSTDEAAAGLEPTATAFRPLTLTYASPEQVRGERVTMASDVYSLGVVLFELLCGRRPFEIRSLAPHEAMMRLCEGRRPAPSSVVREPSDEYDPKAASRARATRPERLARQLRGDLDVIVLAALHKDRTRRYGSAAQLSGDLGRYLAGRPVTARPDSFGYRSSKFIRRNRWPLAVAAAFLALVTASWISRTQQAARIAEERDKAQQVIDFLVGVFEISDPGESRGATVTARELLDEGANRLDVELRDQPLVRAMMSDTMARVYNRLGLHERALALTEEALEIQRREHGSMHVDVAHSLSTLGTGLYQAGRFAEAERRFREAHDIYVELLGPRSQEAAQTTNDLAQALCSQGRYPEAEAALREALETFLDLGLQEKVTMATSNLAFVVEQRGNYQEADLLMARALESARAVYGDPHPELAKQLNNLAAQRATRGDYKQAEQLHREALAMRRKVLGPYHRDVQQSLNNLAIAVFQQGDYPAAEALFREAHDLARARLGDDHPDVAASASNLAAVLNKQGDFAGVEEMAREVLRLRRRQLGDEHPEVATSANNLAAALFSLEKYDEAERYYQEALSLRRKLLGENHPDVAFSLSKLALLRERRGEAAEALALQEQARAILEENFGHEHPEVARALASLAAFQAAAGDPDAALVNYQRAVDQQRRLLEPGHPRLATSLTGWGELLVELGDNAQAETVLSEALEIRRTAFGEAHWSTAVTRSALGACLAASGRGDEGGKMMAEALEALEEARGADHPLTRKARQRLAALGPEAERPSSVP